MGNESGKARHERRKSTIDGTENNNNHMKQNSFRILDSEEWSDVLSIPKKQQKDDVKEEVKKHLKEVKEEREGSFKKPILEVKNRNIDVVVLGENKIELDNNEEKKEDNIQENEKGKV